MFCAGAAPRVACMHEWGPGSHQRGGVQVSSAACWQRRVSSERRAAWRPPPCTTAAMTRWHASSPHWDRSALLRRCSSQVPPPPPCFSSLPPATPLPLLLYPSGVMRRVSCAHAASQGFDAGLSLELELVLAIKCGALRRGYACLAALLSGCADRTLLSRFAAWNNRDKDPDAPAEPEEGADDADPFGKGTAKDTPAGAAATVGPTNVRTAPLSTPSRASHGHLAAVSHSHHRAQWCCPAQTAPEAVPEAEHVMQMASDVIAVFKQAAGVKAPQVLARLANFGVQGRATPLDSDMFTAPPPPAEASAASAPFPAAEPSATSSAAHLATSALPPPSSTKFKPMFPRRPAGGGAAAPPPPAPGDAAGDGSGEVIEGEYDDVIDWDWPLRPPPKAEDEEPAADVAATEEAAEEKGGEEGGSVEQGDGEAGEPAEKPTKAPTVKVHKSSTVSSNTIELGLRLLDATVLYAVRPPRPSPVLALSDLLV